MSVGRRTRLRGVMVLLAVGVLAAGCAGGPATGDLAGSAWVVVEVRDGDVVRRPQGSPATLEFDDERAAGSGGCNSFSATSVTVDDGEVSFGPVQSTEMACEPAEVMDLEAAYLGALGRVTTAGVDGDVLVLRGDGGDLEVALRRR